MEVDVDVEGRQADVGVELCEGGRERGLRRRGREGSRGVVDVPERHFGGWVGGEMVGVNCGENAVIEAPVKLLI